ncbi:uncharacterized protein [Haliotis cracherodii]|uniref:uncharacterized protein n=1 Tax=Haliotis cracherodii TaxID=6455 RepID=UPI0039EB071F
MKVQHSMLDQMKTKNFYIIVVFIGATSLSLWLFNYPTTSFRVIVTKTHKQINNIKNLPSNMQKKSTQELSVDPVYLNALGFSDDTVLIGHRGSGQKSLPVIATSVEPGRMEKTVYFINSVRKYMETRHLVLVDLGVSKTEKAMLRRNCNSTWNCRINVLNYEKYPSHVQYLDIKSYRPICIQELLTEYGAVMWVDTSLYFTNSKINESLALAQASGIAAWTIQDPTSSLTHPKMFQFFKTKPDEFYFHRAVESSHLVIYNTETIHRELMLPWVKCALLEECISPTGAQNVGCNYLRKPLFKYSGCHHYDMSALNVILGLLFDFEVSKYSSSEKIFGTVSKDGMNYTTPQFKLRSVS